MDELDAPTTDGPDAEGAGDNDADHDASGPTADGAPAGGSTGPRRLRRSTTDHMLAGVAGGIAEYFNIDPIIVRIAFVVLTVFGGVGLVLYGSGWLLMSEWERPATTRELFHGSRRHQVVVAVTAIVVGIVILDLLAHGPFWIGGGWRAGQAFGWIVIAGVVGYLVLRGVRGPKSIGRVVRRLSVGLAGLVVLSIVVGVSAELLTGVPLSGGFGSRSWRPTSIGQVAPIYRVGAGNAVLDLSQVRFPNRAVRVEATVGMGHLLVEVPPGVRVSLNARSGIGDVSYGATGESAFLSDGQASGTSSVPLLVLDAQAGIGVVELTRSGQSARYAIAPAVPDGPLKPVAPAA